MKQVAFTMKLYKGCEAEYKRRHASLWPELGSLLSSSGITDYSIFLDENSLVLFAVFKIKNEEQFNVLPQHPVMQRWWNYMKDIMETNEDDSPVTTPLQPMFYLP